MNKEDYNRLLYNIITIDRDFNRGKNVNKDILKILVELINNVYELSNMEDNI